MSCYLRSEESRDIVVPSERKSLITYLFSTDRTLFLICLMLLIFAFGMLVFVPNSVTFVVCADFAILGVVLTCYHCRDRSHAFILLLGTTALAIVAGCEVFYMKDAFAGTNMIA